MIRKTAVFLSLLLLSAPAALARVDYGACVERCEGKFVKVAQEDKNCDDTLGKLAHDFLVLKSFLETQTLCRGRFRTACEEWKNATTLALGQLSDAIGATPRCTAVDVAVLKKSLWPFLPDQACTGDGTYTDFHDYFRNQESLTLELNNRGLRYGVEFRDISGFEDLDGHAPNCQGGLSPVPRIVDTYLRFALSLESLEGYQACMNTCKKPEPEEEKLWGVHDKADGLLKETTESMERLNADESARQQKQLAETTVSTPCGYYQQSYGRLKKVADQLRLLREKAETMEINGKPEAATVGQMESQLQDLEKVLRRIDLDEVATLCQKETEDVQLLQHRKRKVLDAMTNSETCSLGAVDAFGKGGDHGSKCTWTGDCAIPGVCVQGVCANPVKLSEVRPVLEEARNLAADARALKVVGDKGMANSAEREVKRLEEREQAVATKLKQVGWRRAVEGWRDEYRASLKSRVADLQRQLKEAMDQLEEQRESGHARDRSCIRAARKLRGFQTDLQRALDAVEKADPIADAVWVRQRSQTVDEVEKNLEELMPQLSGMCSVGEDTDSGVAWWVWVLSGLGLVTAGLILVVVLKKKK